MYWSIDWSTNGSMVEQIESTENAKPEQIIDCQNNVQ